MGIKQKNQKIKIQMNFAILGFRQELIRFFEEEVSVYFLMT